MTYSFREMLEQQNRLGNFLCVGLDNPAQKSKDIVRETNDLVCAYKVNPAFYLRQGEYGFSALLSTCQMVKKLRPDIPLIIDGKYGDVRHTNEAWAEFAFHVLGGDAVTVQPNPGNSALGPFLSRREKGVFVVCRMSASSEIQELAERFAYLAGVLWNSSENVGIVASTDDEQTMRGLRGIVGDNVPILVAGLGAQGVDPAKAYAAGKNSTGHNIILSASRSIGESTEPRREVEKLRATIAACFV